MIISKTSREAIENALQLTNEVFDGNVEFYKLEAKNAKQTRFVVRLKVKDSNGNGAKQSATMTRKDGEYRRSSWACWHVHGTFHDFLNEDAVIRSGYASEVKSPGDEWTDWQAGSMFNPRYASECCDCDHYSFGPSRYYG